MKPLTEQQREYRRIYMREYQRRRRGSQPRPATSAGQRKHQAQKRAAFARILAEAGLL